MVTEEDIGRANHGLGQVAMEVEREGQGSPRADDPAEGGGQVSLGIVQTLDAHGAVAGQQDALNRLLPAQAFNQPALQGAVASRRKRIAGVGPSRDQRDHLHLLLGLEDGKKAADFGVRPAEVQELGAFQQVAGSAKEVQPGQTRHEMVGFG